MYTFSSFAKRVVSIVGCTFRVVSVVVVVVVVVGKGVREKDVGSFI